MDQMEMKNWLITGGCGFIGVNLVNFLLKTNPRANIRVLDNLSVGARADLAGICPFKEIDPKEIKGQPQGVELAVGDIRNFPDCQNNAQGIDVVVHLAANTGVAPSVLNPRLDMECNAVGTFNMLEAACQHGVARFIFASSGATVGEVSPPIHEEKVPKPVSPYGASKLAGEGYCLAYWHAFGLRTVALRFGNVYGPRSKHKTSVVAKFFQLALKGEPLEVYGDGDQTRDFIFIDDLVRAIMLATKPQVGGEVFQVASSKETTVNEIAQRIKGLVEKDLGKKVEIIHGKPRLGDVRKNYADTSKAKRYLGYEPEYDLESGLRITLDYYISNRLG